MKPTNIFAELPASLDRELAETLASSSDVNIERIVSNGQSTPKGVWLEEERTEWVILLSGSAGILFECEEEVVALKPGDHLCIPPRTRHRVEWTDQYEPSLWLAVHYKQV